MKELAKVKAALNGNYVCTIGKVGVIHVCMENVGTGETAETYVLSAAIKDRAQMYVFDKR